MSWTIMKKESEKKSGVPWEKRRRLPFLVPVVGDSPETDRAFGIDLMVTPEEFSENIYM